MQVQEHTLGLQWCCVVTRAKRSSVWNDSYNSWVNNSCFYGRGRQQKSMKNHEIRPHHAEITLIFKYFCRYGFISESKPHTKILSKSVRMHEFEHHKWLVYSRSSTWTEHNRSFNEQSNLQLKDWVAE